MKFDDLDNYNYELPENLIRKVGLEPRDSAKIFVYNTKTDEITFDTFSNISKYLPERSLLVLNDSKVMPARLWLQKETGGKIEVFVLANEIRPESDLVPVIVDRKISTGQRLLFPNGDYFQVESQNEQKFYLSLHSKSSLFDLLNIYGETPIPHYLEGSGIEETDLRKRYQTIFAQNGASVAAPTASLHFTDNVFDSLEKKGIESIKVTLNVGMGTFSPLTQDNFDNHALHTEYIDVSEDSVQKINDCKDNGQKIVAVGTTALRTLESVTKNGAVEAYSGPTNIFIYPPHDLQITDILITNFHLPKTSLMLLVDAFLKNKNSKKGIVDLYTIAIENGFAFYSFGDSMLIL